MPTRFDAQPVRFFDSTQDRPVQAPRAPQAPKLVNQGRASSIEGLTEVADKLSRVPQDVRVRMLEVLFKAGRLTPEIGTNIIAGMLRIASENDRRAR